MNTVPHPKPPAGSGFAALVWQNPRESSFTGMDCIVNDQSIITGTKFVTIIISDGEKLYPKYSWKHMTCSITV